MDRLSDSQERVAPGWIAFVAVLSALAFLPRAPGEFVWDDVFLVQNNPWLYRFSGLGTLLTTDLWGQATGRPAHLFHPIPVLTLWLQGCLHGPNLVGFRIGNWVLHGVAILLFHRVLRRLSFSRRAAFLAAAVVGLHPSVTEPVMWITGRHDTVGAVFILLALWAWPRRDEPWTRALWAGASAGLAFLSKEQFIVAPFLLAAHACIQAHAGKEALPWRRLPLAFTGLAMALVWRRQVGVPLGSDQLALGFFDLARNYASIVHHYAGQILGLRNGATFAPFVPSGTLATVATALGIAGLLGLATLAFWRHPHTWAATLFGLVWFFLSLAPYLAAIPAIGYFGNRYAYLPMFGLSIAVTGLGVALLKRLPQPKPILRRVVFGLLPITLAASTALGAAAWSSDRALYSADVLSNPSNGFAQYHLGYAILRRYGCQEALPYFRAATYYAPTYERGWHNVTGCLLNLGQADQAIEPARRALALDPGNASNHYNLAAALANTGKLSDARAALRMALQLDPTHVPSQRLSARLSPPASE